MSAPLVLVIQHAESETMGLLEPFCRELGIAWHLCRPYAGEPVPPATQPYQGVIVMGGPMNVEENERYPFLAEEVRLLQSALRRQVPVLGICLGAQLLAKAAGAEVFHGPAPEIGWFPVQLTEQGQQDPLWTGLPTEFVTFHWHGDTFDLPPKAIHLASSQQYAHQAFRLGEQAYGIQFHLEITPELVQRWVAESPQVEPAPILEGLAQHAEPAAQLGRTVLTRWLQKVVALQEQEAET